MPKLSAAIITLNEETRLPACIKSLQFVDEVIVVDSGSRDKTVSIAKDLGAKVYQEQWLGYGKQKQLAIDYCSNDWVIILDADERIPQKTASSICKAVQDPGGNVSFQLPRKNLFLGRWIKHAGWWPDYVVRIINKHKCQMSSHIVHESIVSSGPTGTITEPIEHYATQNLSHTMEKMNAYSSAGAREMHDKGEGASYSKAFARGAWAFFYNYFFRLGLLDGGPGFIIAVSDATNKFFKYAKLTEFKNP